MTTAQELIATVDVQDEFERYARGAAGGVDPYELYEGLLAEGGPVYVGDVMIEHLGMRSHPVALHDGPKYTVLGFEEAAEVLRKGDRFSSRIFELAQGKNIGRTILTMDDPDHRIHRLLVQSAFTRKAMDRWQDQLVEPLVARMLDGIEPAGRAEVVNEFSRPLPVEVIHEILGLPTEHLPELKTLATGLLLGVPNPPVAGACARRVGELLDEHLRARKANPTGDVVSTLVNERLPSGETLTDEEILSFLRVLLPAGAETTTRLISSMMAQVLTEPGLADALRAEPDLIPGAISETLRLHPPFQYAYRLCTETTEIGGVEIPENAGVSICIASANRDPGKYPDPTRFDLTRTSNNLAFGLGMHICLGVHLARMETEVAFRAFLARFPRLRLDPDKPSPRSGGPLLASPAMVHVRWD